MQNKTFLFKALRDEFGLQEKDEPILKSVGLDADSIVEELLL